MRLSTDTEESRGNLHPPISGSITFNHVSFSYPERPDVPVLRDINFEIKMVRALPSSCIRLRKSTVVALLQRLYEPDEGFISIGPLGA